MVLETKERIIEKPYPIINVKHTHDGVALIRCDVPYYMNEMSANNIAMSYSMIIPVIENVSVYKDTNGNDKSVVIEFADGTKEKASTRHGDKFDLETGISLCIAKKMYATLARTYGKSSGFSKIVHKAVKIYNNGVKEEESRKKRVAEEKLAEQRRIAKRKKRAEKRRQRKVNLLKDAFVAAFNETKKEG